MTWETSRPFLLDGHEYRLDGPSSSDGRVWRFWKFPKDAPAGSHTHRFGDLNPAELETVDAAELPRKIIRAAAAIVAVKPKLAAWAEQAEEATLAVAAQLSGPVYVLPGRLLPKPPGTPDLAVHAATAES